MSAIAWMIERFNWLSEYFYDAYLQIWSWPFPFWEAAWPFYAASQIFSRIAWDLYDFSWWVTDVENTIRQVIGWDTIWRNIRSSVYWIFLDIRALADWLPSVRQIVTDWWSFTNSVVQGWIEAASQLLQDQVDNVNNLLTTLQGDLAELVGSIPTLNEVIAWWSDWTGDVLLMINTWWTGALLEVQELINSAFVSREQFWAGWQDWRGQVTEFFSDPEDQVLKILERALERYW